MAENQWVSLGLFHLWIVRVISPFIAGCWAHFVHEWLIFIDKMGPPSQRIANPMIFENTPVLVQMDDSKVLRSNAFLGNHYDPTWQTITKQLKALRNCLPEHLWNESPIEMENDYMWNLPVESLIHLSLKLTWGKGRLLSTLQTRGGCISPKKNKSMNPKY